MRRGEEEGRRRAGGGQEEEREEEEQAGRRRDTDGTQAGYEEEEEKTGRRGRGSRVRVHDSFGIFIDRLFYLCRLQFHRYYAYPWLSFSIAPGL